MERKTSTIVIGIFILISLIFVIWLIPYNLSENIVNYKKSINDQNYNVEGEMTLVINLFAGIGLFALLVAGYLPSFLVLINSIISLIFSIKNRKSTSKPIRIINYSYDIVLGLFIIFAITKIVIFSAGIG